MLLPKMLAAAVVVAAMKSRQGVRLFQIVVVGSAMPLAGVIRRVRCYEEEIWW